MDLLIDPALLPATLTGVPMSDEEFAAFCDEHPDLSFETTAEGDLLVMPPTYTLAGARNIEIAFQLQRWTRQDKRGIAFDSSTGFVTPDGARKSPDAAWVSKSRIGEMAPEVLGMFWRLCPDFVIEVKSETDRLPILRKKMQEWIANGAAVAWLVNPEARTVEIYRPAAPEPQIIDQPERVIGEGPVAAFELDLAPVWNPLG